MPNDISSQRGTVGTSMSINNQKGTGGMKPSESAGKHDPGGFKPPRDGEMSVPNAVEGPTKKYPYGGKV